MGLSSDSQSTGQNGHVSHQGKYHFLAPLRIGNKGNMSSRHAKPRNTDVGYKQNLADKKHHLIRYVVKGFNLIHSIEKTSHTSLSEKGRRLIPAPAILLHIHDFLIKLFLTFDVFINYRLNDFLPGGLVFHFDNGYALRLKKV